MIARTETSRIALSAALAIAFASAAATISCSGGGSAPGAPPGDGPVTPGDTTPGDPAAPPAADAGATPPAPKCTDFGKKYVGFGGADLTASRVPGGIGEDRARIKPYESLKSEFTRVVGNAPALIDTSSATFGATQARWFIEPHANAVSVYTAYHVAFEACVASTAGDAAYAAAPTAETAATACAAMASAMWSRTPSGDEIAACAKVATDDTAKEPDPHRRWAYACASVLSAAGFLTY